MVGVDFAVGADGVSVAVVEGGELREATPEERKLFEQVAFAAVAPVVGPQASPGGDDSGAVGAGDDLNREGSGAWSRGRGPGTFRHPGLSRSEVKAKLAEARRHKKGAK